MDNEYIREGLKFALDVLDEMDKETCKQYYFNEYKFDKEPPIDEVENIICLALKCKLGVNENLNESNELFEYAIELIKKEVKLKNNLKKILNDLESYINELMYQAKCITKLSESEDKTLKQIGKEYKKSFEENFNKKQITKKNNHKRRY